MGKGHSRLRSEHRAGICLPKLPAFLGLGTKKNKGREWQDGIPTTACVAAELCAWLGG